MQLLHYWQLVFIGEVVVEGGWNWAWGGENWALEGGGRSSSLCCCILAPELDSPTQTSSTLFKRGSEPRRPIAASFPGANTLSQRRPPVVCWQAQDPVVTIPAQVEPWTLPGSGLGCPLIEDQVDQYLLHCYAPDGGQKRGSCVGLSLECILSYGMHTETSWHFTMLPMSLCNLMQN